MEKSSTEKESKEESSKINDNQNNNKRSELSLKGGKTHLSIYTRRVIDI
jgi:hypothetical protein